MRTTLTISPDVAALLKKALHKEGRSMKEVVNDALRRGLLNEDIKNKASRPYFTRAHSAGRILVGEAINIGELLSRLDESER